VEDFFFLKRGGGGWEGRRRADPPPVHPLMSIQARIQDFWLGGGPRTTFWGIKKGTKMKKKIWVSHQHTPHPSWECLGWIFK